MGVSTARKASIAAAKRRAGAPLELGPRSQSDNLFGGWHQIATFAGIKLWLSVVRGSPHRIAFKPRGQNVGFHWYGYVRDACGKEWYSARVPKGKGAKGLLEDCGVYDTWEIVKGIASLADAAKKDE